ncbi:MAG: PAS domain S-box protein [Deltaproteobacteria bacterium]|nr:PAS domain S-box protein [Deltaproteobacteria bacterium]
MKQKGWIEELEHMKPDCINEINFLNATHLINQLPDATFALDINGKIIAWNNALEGLTGYTAKDMMGKGNYEHSLPFWKVRRPMSIDLVLVPNDKLEKSYTDLNREGNCLIVKAEVPGIRINGKTAYLWKKASPLYDGKGIITGAIMSIRDITYLYEKDMFYRTLLNNLQIGVYIVQDGKIVFANHHIPRYSGYSMEELNCTDILSFVHPEDRQMARGNAIAMLKGNLTIPYEFRIVDKSGNITWLMESVSSIQYNGKRAVIGNTMEITEMKEAQNKLEQLEKLEASILTSVPHALFGVENREIFFANESMETVFGWTVEELIGQKTRILFRTDQEHKDYGELLYSELEKKECYIFEWEHPFVRKDGKEIVCRMSVARIGEKLTERKRIVATFEDITEIKLAEEALRELQQRLAVIIEFLPDAMFAIDLEGKLIAWNRAAEELTGVRAKDILGKGAYEYALPFWKVRRPMAINLVLEPNKEFEKTYSVFNREGNLLIVEAKVPGIRIKGRKAYLWCKASPLYDSKGNIAGAIEVIRDTTDRKLAEEFLKKREKELETQSHELAELNTALKVLLKRREEDKSELEERLLANVRELVLPYIEELKRKRLDDRNMSYVKILESNLRNIISPFSHKLSYKYMNLTNREVRVADLIKDGKSSKEIADFLNITESAVNIYRYRMRKKLGLKKKDNLKAYLLSLA